MDCGAAGRRDNKNESPCPLCLEYLAADAGRAVLELPCSHRFHTQCINKWMEIKRCCPCCRARAAEPAGAGRSERICTSGFTAGMDPQIRASTFTAGRASLTAGVGSKILASGFTGDANRQPIRASGFTSTDSTGIRHDERIRASGFTSSARSSLEKKGRLKKSGGHSGAS